MKIDVSDLDREDIESIRDVLFIEYNDFGYDYITSLIPLQHFIVLREE